MEKMVSFTAHVEGSEKLLPSHIDIDLQYGSHGHFELRLPLESDVCTRKSLIDASKTYCGKKISVFVKYTIGDKQQDEELFKGIITEVMNSRREGANKFLLLKGLAPTILLDKDINTRSFTKKSLKDIASELSKPLKAYISTLKVETAPTSEIPYPVQYMESSYRFLHRNSIEQGVWFFYDGLDLHLGKPGDTNVKLCLGENLIEFSTALSFSPSKHKEIQVDYLEPKTFEEETSAAKIKGFKDYRFLFEAGDKIYKETSIRPVHEEGKDKKGLEKQLINRVASQSSQMVRATGSSTDPRLKIGMKIQVSEKDKEEKSIPYGSYRVISISHLGNEYGNYQNLFTAIPDDVEASPIDKPIYPVKADPQSAIVKEIDDPNNLGRIKVQFPWQDAKEMSPWIRATSIYAGKNHGWYSRHEIGDEVMVGFEQGNPSRPFVMGALYNGKNSPETWYTSDNQKLGWKSKEDNQFVFIDKKGQPEIHVINGDNSIIMTMGKGGSITIEAKQALNFSAPEINFDTQKFSVDTKQFNISTKEGKMSGTTMDISAQGNIKMKAPLIEIN